METWRQEAHLSSALAELRRAVAALDAGDIEAARAWVVDGIRDCRLVYDALAKQAEQERGGGGHD